MPLELVVVGPKERGRERLLGEVELEEDESEEEE